MLSVPELLYLSNFVTHKMTYYQEISHVHLKTVGRNILQVSPKSKWLVKIASQWPGVNLWVSKTTLVGFCSFLKFYFIIFFLYAFRGSVIVYIYINVKVLHFPNLFISFHGGRLTCTYVYQLSPGALRGQKRLSNSLKTDSQLVVCWLLRDLKTQSVSSAGAASIWNCSPTSPAPNLFPWWRV